LAVRLLLDTNRYTDLFRKLPDTVTLVEEAEAVFLPFIALAELRAGFVQGDRQPENERALRAFLARSGVAALFPDDQTTLYYASVQQQLRRQGTPIPTNDLWIAALALQYNLTLHSRDGHFDRLPQIVRA
jgi:tRNA(fMet)-specific endonuclease VapC